MRAAPPNSGSHASTSSGSRSRPVTAASPFTVARTVSVMTSGHSWAPMRVTAAARRGGGPFPRGPRGAGDDQRPLGGADGGARRGEAGARVVAVPHRPVARRALRLQPQPIDALLGRLNEVQPRLVVQRDAEPA